MAGLQELFLAHSCGTTVATLVTSPCRACFKGHLERKPKPVTAIYRGHAISYVKPGFWCDHCDEGIVFGTGELLTRTK